jgi:ATP synthase proteolipid subunit
LPVNFELQISISRKTKSKKKDLGAGYGTAKAGVGIAGMGARKPQMIMKSLIPIVMAGILGIYGMIVSVVLMKNSNPKIIRK